MSDIETIQSFARDFINGIGRTTERKRLIESVYSRRFGERLRVNCGTCYIEAIFKIIKPMENKKTCSYRLRKGIVLQPFSGGIITNDNLTDEIAVECLNNRVANPSMFAVMPETPPDELTIVPTDETDKDIDETDKDVDQTGGIETSHGVDLSDIDKADTESPAESEVDTPAEAAPIIEQAAESAVDTPAIDTPVIETTAKPDESTVRNNDGRFKSNKK